MYEALQQIDTLEQEAISKYDDKQYAKAATLYKRLIHYAEIKKDYVNIIRYVIMLITCYLEAKDYKMACRQVELYDYLFAHNVTSSQKKQYTLLKATLHIKTGEYQRAELYFQQLLQMSLDEDECWEIIQYGTQYMSLLHRMGQDDKALSIATLIEGYLEGQENRQVEQSAKFYVSYVAVLLKLNFAEQAQHYLTKANTLLATLPISKYHMYAQYYDICVCFALHAQTDFFARFEQVLQQLYAVLELDDYVWLLEDCIMRYEQAACYKEMALLQKHYITLLTDPTYVTMKAQVKETVKKLHLSEAQKLAHYDSLTGVYNRYYLEKQAENTILMSRITDENCSCAVFDIDHFKKINDSFGHLAGDQAIQMLAQRVAQQIKGAPVLFARYGGDEFVLILSMPVAQAEDFIMSLYEELHETPLQLQGMELALTCSMGLVHNEHVQANSFQELFRRADEALYFAKQNGRNQLYIDQ